MEVILYLHSTLQLTKGRRNY